MHHLYKPAAKPVEAVTADTTSCKNRKGAFERSFSDSLGFWNKPPSCADNRRNEGIGAVAPSKYFRQTRQQQDTEIGNLGAT